METIRRAAAPDLEVLAPLFDAYRTFFTSHSDPNGSKTFLKERLAKQDSVVLAAFKDEKATGFLQLYPLFSSWYTTRIWFLSDLYVTESHRKSGIGKRLVARAQTYAKETTSRSIMVEIPHSEPHLVTFYEGLRFERDKTFDLYRYYLTE
ncbi:MAG TPA: GNAT family N-acetyltransferase [Candidatus Baltobacteraceae bacterium]|jgi:GNAT superfamily N-acetyltransferase|nr:GNAT family N-acetyltransferase [Candidatus Baltobacteraceae bacterium]